MLAKYNRNNVSALLIANIMFTSKPQCIFMDKNNFRLKSMVAKPWKKQ